MSTWKKIIVSGSGAHLSSVTASNGVVITGSLVTTGSNTLIGTTQLTGSLYITGSQDIVGYIGLQPVATLAIPTDKSASYIYTSGSTNDMYFTQYNGPYTNTTRLRWLESNISTGLLYGGVLSSTPGSTTFTITGGEGIIVAQNAFTGSSPYPTITTVQWPTQTLPITNSGSAKITYVGINDSGTVVQQVVPWGSTDINQFDTQIDIGVVLHLSGSVSTGVFNAPQIGYAHPQQTDDFIRAFGPIKISGHTLQASGSTLSIIKSGGTSYLQGANYRINPNHPSTVEESAVTVSKIYRYYISGSTPVIDTGVANAGYTVINPTQRVDTTTGTLTSVATNKYSLQRVFWVPNSPTNAFLVYYGNAEYASLVDALNGKDTEPFTEAPNTATNAIFLGWIAVAGGATSLTNATDATIAPAGIFRSIGGIGSTGTTPVSTTLSGLSDVSVASRTAGDLLYYNGSQWTNSKDLNAVYTVTGSFNINGSLTVGTTTITNGSITGSLQGSSSYSTNSLSSSFATNSSTASYVLNAVSASFATTASYVLGGGGISDGDKGDITVSSGGSTWTIDNSAVTFAKMQNISPGVLGRQTAGSGNITTLTALTDYHVLQWSAGAPIWGSISTNNIQIFNDNRILGRGTSGVTSELSLGNGLAITGTTLFVTSSAFTGSLEGTSSYATQALSASYATTASYLLGGGGASVSNPGNNYIITSDGTSGGLVGESNLLFDGTNLTVSGSVYLSGSLYTPIFVDYEEKYTSPTISGNTLTLNLANGNIFQVTIDSSINTFTVSSPPALNNAGSFVLVTIGNGTPYSIQWGTAVTWSGGSAPSVTSTNGKKDIYGFISTNQGTNWYGFVGGQNL